MLFGGIIKSKEEGYSEKEEEEEEKQPLQFKANWYAKDVISIFKSFTFTGVLFYLFSTIN